MYKDEQGNIYTTHDIMNKSMHALDSVSRQSKNVNAGWCSFRDHSEHDLSFQGIYNYLVLHMTEMERKQTRELPDSILAGVDSIGIATALHGYIIASSSVGRPIFKDDTLEDQAVINLAALISSRFPTAVIIIPASAASLGLGLEWDVKRCMIRATFGSFGIPVISPDMLSTNIVWHHHGGLIEGYMRLSDDNVHNLVTMLSSAQRLANALRKPGNLGFPARRPDAPG